MGFGIGGTLPLACIYLASSVPMQYRAMSLCISQGVIYGVGEIYTIFLADIVLLDLDNGDWKKFYLLLPLPAVFALIMNIIFLKEPPRE